MDDDLETMNEESMNDLCAYREAADICERRFGATVYLERRNGRYRVLKTVKPTVRAVIADASSWARVVELLQEQAQGPGQPGNEESDARLEVMQLCGERFGAGWTLFSNPDGKHWVTLKNGDDAFVGFTWIDVLTQMKRADIAKASREFHERPIQPRNPDGGYSHDVAELVRAARKVCTNHEFEVNEEARQITRRSVSRLHDAAAPFGSVES